MCECFPQEKVDQIKAKMLQVARNFVAVFLVHVKVETVFLSMSHNSLISWIILGYV